MLILSKINNGISLFILSENEEDGLLDKIIYTDEAKKEDLFEELNILLSRFIREISTREDDKTS